MEGRKYFNLLHTQHILSMVILCWTCAKEQHMRGNLLPPLDPSLNEQTLILPYTSDPNRIGRFNAFNPANHARHDNEYYIEWLKGLYSDIQQTHIGMKRLRLVNKP